MTIYPQIFLDTSKSGSFQGHHPWVLDRSVIDPTVPFEPGTIVDLMHPKGYFIGRGVYNPTSRIRVRLYQWSSDFALDQGWLHGQLGRAVELRSRWMDTHHSLDSIRLVNSEGDGLSGLVVDQFGEYIVVQCSSLAMQKWSDSIATWLQARFQPKAIAVRSDSKTIESEGMVEQDQWLGTIPEHPIEVIENGVRLQLDLVHSQKTGYYLDQRANRLEAARWVNGSMLDVCAYIGGFSLAACRWGKPSHIVAIDSSKRALEMAQSNATLNGFSQIEFVNDDCFDHLQKLTQSSKRFQTIVLDPPRMASNRSNVNGALRAYHRLNSMALKLLEPSGILVTCSCSGRVTREDFFGVVASAAEREKRSLQVIRNLGADFDHPVATNCPESEYLKCLICRAN